MGSTFRKHMERFFPNKEGHFVRFLCRTRSIFEEIKRKGGDIDKVFDILWLIKDEELRYINYKGAMLRLPYPWEGQGYRVVMIGEGSTTVEEIVKGKDTPRQIEVSRMPKLVNTIYELLNNFVSESTRSFRCVDGTGNIHVTCTVEVEIDGKKYRILCSHADYLHKVNKLSSRKPRGRKGEPLASVAMFLLHKYLKFLGIRDIYTKIALLVGEFSTLLFRKGEKIMLDANMVRKRIQWVKNKPEVLRYALEFEAQLPMTRNSRRRI
ncbi:hypothetical protein [Hydrogenivirga sp.]